MSRQKIFAAVAVLVLSGGIAAAVRLVQSRPEPKTIRAAPPARLVRVRRLRRQSKKFWIFGFGTVRPKTKVTVVPEVSGRIVHRSESFRTGGFIRKGEILVEIDPRSYRLTVSQRTAQLKELEADIALLRQEEKNQRTNLVIEERNLSLARAELKRNERLRRQKIVSQGKLDAAQQAFLVQEKKTQGVRNALALLPAQIAQKQAALEVTRAQLMEARLNVQRTKIRSPFDGRVMLSQAEIGNYARAGEVLGSVYDMSALEVPVSVPVEDARWVFRRIRGASFPRSQEEVRRFFPSAQVLWSRFRRTYRWDGRVTLVEAELEKATRALTLIVEVPEPLKNWEPGKHPPLAVGMFVRVRIEGVSVPDVFVVPRTALHANDRVYLLKKGRLEIRPVQVLRKGKDEAVLVGGVREGEQLVLSAIPAPVSGMRLRTLSEREGELAGRNGTAR